MSDACGKQRLRTVEEHLREDREREGLLRLSTATDLVLAELWDNDRDAAYDRVLARRLMQEGL